MKCKRCGMEFSEGIFCPECGMKSEERVHELERQEQREREEQERIIQEEQERKRREQIEKEEKEKQEKKRLESERKAAEKRAREQEIKNRIELENAEAERLQQENTRKEIESRTVKGVIYKTFEEAEQARIEHKKIDLLKEKLLLEKSSQKRKEIYSNFHETILIKEVKYRYDLLQETINNTFEKSRKLNIVYGISVIITFILAMIFELSNKNEILFTVFMIWTGFGVWIWPIWKIVLVVKNKKLKSKIRKI